MEELKDYSGQFDPGLRPENFSKEALVKLWLSASQLYTGMAWIYLSENRAKLGDKDAFELDREVWKKTIPLQIQLVNHAINNHGKDVAAVFKFLQCYAASGAQLEMALELKNPNYGIYTVKKCPAYAEGHDPAVTQHYCSIDCEWGWQLQASCINPDIKVTCLKQPPPANEKEIACQWEYKL